MSKCFHCGEIGSDLGMCHICQNNYCKFHIDPVVHECRLTMESHKLQHEYNVAMHPEIVEHVNPNHPVRGTTDGSYTWAPPEIDASKKKPVIPSKFIKNLKKYDGILFLFFLIVFFSLIALDFWNKQFLRLSSYGILLGYYWTLLTSLFVVSMSSIEGIIFFVINLVFMFIVTNKLRKKTSMKLVYSVFGFSGFFSGLVFLIFRFSIAILIPIGFLDIFTFSVGLAGAGFLGLTAFSVFFEPNLDWNFYMYGMPIKVKGKHLLLVIVALRFAPLLSFGFFNVLNIVNSIFEIVGILAAYIYFKCWNKLKKVL